MPLCPGSPTLTATCWQQGSLSVNAPFHMHTEFSLTSPARSPSSPCPQRYFKVF